jgi:hypothetical protein
LPRLPIFLLGPRPQVAAGDGSKLLAYCPVATRPTSARRSAHSTSGVRQSVERRSVDLSKTRDLRNATLRRFSSKITSSKITMEHLSSQIGPTCRRELCARVHERIDQGRMKPRRWKSPWRLLVGGLRPDLVLHFTITVTYFTGGKRLGLIPSCGDREVLRRQDTAHTSSTSLQRSGPRWKREPANIRHRIETSSARRSSCSPPRDSATISSPHDSIRRARSSANGATVSLKTECPALRKSLEAGRAARFSPQRRRRR